MKLAFPAPANRIVLITGLVLLTACTEGLTSPTEPAAEPNTAVSVAPGALLLDGFENRTVGDWHTWTSGGASLSLRIVSPGAAGSRNAMNVRYVAKSTALAQREFAAPADWSSYDTFEFSFYGNASGNTIRLEIKDNGSSSPNAELFEYLIKDDFRGWKGFSLGWDSFTRRKDWQPAGAASDGFNRTGVWGFRFTPLAGSGNFSVDQIALGRIQPSVTPVPVEPAPAPAPEPAPAPIPTQPVTCATDGAARVVNVSTAAQLRTALSAAQPGDFIRLADGVYSGTFSATASGTEAQRITLCGSSAAVLRGTSITSGYGFHLTGSYWKLQGFTLTNSLSGLMIVGGDYNLIDNLTVEGLGQEAVSFERFSSYNVLQNSRIRNTGLHIAEYGEGVYIGSWKGHWAEKTGGQPDASDHNRIVNNTFGPDVRSEHIDAKEGSRGGVISGNTFIGSGMVKSQPWVDSWVELKGNGYTITGNTGTGAITDGYQVHVEVDGWGQNNTFSANTINLGGAPGFGVRISAPANVVRCDNVVQNAGSGLTNIACQ